MFFQNFQKLFRLFKVCRPFPNIFRQFCKKKLKIVFTPFQTFLDRFHNFFQNYFRPFEKVCRPFSINFRQFSKLFKTSFQAVLKLFLDSFCSFKKYLNHLSSIFRLLLKNSRSLEVFKNIRFFNFFCINCNKIVSNTIVGLF